MSHLPLSLSLSPLLSPPPSHFQEEEHRRLVEQRERELKEAEAARIKAEREAEAARAAALEAEKEENLQEQTQDAFAVISDLDSALKAFQGALGLDVRYVRI